MGCARRNTKPTEPVGQVHLQRHCLQIALAALGVTSCVVVLSVSHIRGETGSFENFHADFKPRFPLRATLLETVAGFVRTGRSGCATLGTIFFLEYSLSLKRYWCLVISFRSLLFKRFIYFSEREWNATKGPWGTFRAVRVLCWSGGRFSKVARFCIAKQGARPAAPRLIKIRAGVLFRRNLITPETVETEAAVEKNTGAKATHSPTRSLA